MNIGFVALPYPANPTDINSYPRNAPVPSFTPISIYLYDDTDTLFHEADAVFVSRVPEDFIKLLFIYLQRF